ncbi:MAG: hypothetical protein KA954_00250 [Chitinophagales bacterium]|nr:hypothetical protein [Chitinophagales bacterium]MBP8754807.1 hypothetical protein [Chitinophagales bacterium]MBP9188323.1 hypothetical protein [Chitinophagales bacterium]
MVKILENRVSELERKKKSRHKVFITSFESKECYTTEFIQQKLNYIHNNPVSKHWSLATVPKEYIHSSAKFYLTGEQGIYHVKHYLDFYDIPLSK